jgi:hypothetical protein
MIDASLLITIADSVDDLFMNWLSTPQGDQSYYYSNNYIALPYCTALFAVLYFGCYLLSEYKSSGYYRMTLQD